MFRCRFAFMRPLRRWPARAVFAGLGAGACAALGGCAGIAGQAPRPQIELTAIAQSRAEALYTQGDWPAAQRAYEEVVTLAPQRAGAWLKLGNCRARQGWHEPAAQAFAQALALDPRDARSAYNLGLMRVAQAEAALAQARAQGARLGELAPEVLRLHEVLRWLASGDAAPAPRAAAAPAKSGP
jgi:tetratricopeptide (TPR) repeat protein